MRDEIWDILKEHSTNMAYWHIHTVTYEHFSGAS
jgi:hypothetical protein